MAIRHRFLVLGCIAAIFLVACSPVVSTEHGNVDLEAQDSVYNEQEHANEPIPEFVATNEWKEVLPGQGIPIGLHVRMNLETGKKEAKLLDPNDDDEVTSTAEEPSQEASINDKSITVVTDVEGNTDVVEPGSNSQEEEDDHASDDTTDTTSEELKNPDDSLNHEKIYETLQALPEPPKVEGMDLYEAYEKLSPQEFRLEIIRLWKQRQADLQAAIDAMQDDSHYMEKLINQFREAEQNQSTQDQLNLLEVMEWEVQDVDKTRVFSFVGGFDFIMDLLNSSNLPIRANAAWVIGTAVKNFREAQDSAIAIGIIPKLVESVRLPYTQQGDGQEQEEVLDVKRKALYALSSLVRFNPIGQKLFTLHDGPQAISQLMDDTHPSNVQLKAALLVHDLLMELEQNGEQEQIESHDSLRQTLQSTEWCQRIATFFVSHGKSVSPSHALELMDVMQRQLPACQDTFRTAQVESVVRDILVDWAENNELDPEQKVDAAEFVENLLAML